MSSGALTDKRTDKPLLPSHGTAEVTNPHGTTKATGQAEYWEEKYLSAKENMFKLEEELDVLLHCADLLREQRTNLTIGRLSYPTRSSSSKPTLEGSDKLIDDYLALAAKSKDIDDMIKAVKQDCAAGRSNCDYLLTKIPRYRTRAMNLGQALENRQSLARGCPESGFVDSKAVAERIMAAESAATNLAAVVGAFGAGITYTTIFSASRGRLDLISWAFTCFVMVIIDCAALQMFALPPHGQLARILRMEYPGSPDNRVVIYTLLVGIPMLAGFVLLGISVAILDGGVSQAEPGSQLATRIAGYLPVAFLGYFVILIILTGLAAVVIYFLPRRLLPGAEDMFTGPEKPYASFIFPLQEKLYFLPGGPGYRRYRQKRLTRKSVADLHSVG